MKKIHTAGLLAAMLFAALPVATSAKELSLRADAWCPYNCEPGKAPGYLVEIAGMALGEAGHKVDYKLIAWSEALAQVQAGRFTAAVGASATEAPSLVFPRESLGITQTILVTLKGHGVHATGLKSLDGLRIGFGADYFYEESVNAYLDAHKKEPRLVAVGGDNLTEDLIRLLVDGKVDAIIEDVNVIDYQAETKGYQGIFDYAPIGKPSSVSIGFSPADPDARIYAALVDAKVRQLRASGELKRIMARYGLREPQ